MFGSERNDPESNRFLPFVVSHHRRERARAADSVFAWGCLNDEDTAGPRASSNQIKVAARVLNHQSLRVGSIIIEIKLPVIEEAEVNPNTISFGDF